MADEAGVPAGARYVEDKGAITDRLDEAIASVRKGDALWVADLTVIADKRDDLLERLKMLSGAKVPVAIHEGRTGRVSLPPHDGQHMAIEAMARWSSTNKKFGTMTAKEAGAKGGQVSSRARAKLKLPKNEAAKHWRDPALFHLNTDEITAHINNIGREMGFKKSWSTAMLYRALGKRGTFAGPKAKQ